MTRQVFITPEFQKAWWDTLGKSENGTLQVITIRNESGLLIGLAPLYHFITSEGQTQMSFIGCVNVSDYLDFIVDQDYVNEVYDGIIEKLHATPQAVNSFFCSIPATSPTLSTFKEKLLKDAWQIKTTQQDVCPVISLPKTWDEYLAAIGKKQRHEIKRKWKKLFDEQDAEFELVELPNQAEAAITDFITLHQASSQEKKNFWNDDHVRFFIHFTQKTAEKSWLKLYFLKVNNVRVAAMLGFAYNNQFFLYNSGFVADQYREYGIGSVLTAYTIQQAIERGNVRYDFLRGDEAYKFRFRAVSEPVFDIQLTRISGIV